MHQQCASNLQGELYAYLKKKPCRVFAVPFDARLLRSTGNRRTALANGDDQVKTVVQPDLCVICDPAKIDQCGCLGAPD
ncbi:MAG: hypothetical protein ACRYFK_17105 [Janthinobacterium lividum]